MCFNSRDLPVNTSATGSRAWVLLYAKSCALARQAGSTLYCGRLFLLTVVCLPSWQSPLLRRHYCNCSCPTYLGTPSPPPTEPKHKARPDPPIAHVKVGATPQTPWATPSNESSARVLNRTYHAEQWGCTSAPPPRPAPGQSHLPLSEDSKRIPHTRMYVEWPPHP